MAARPYIKRTSILGGEPLTNENLDGVLNLVNEILLSFGDTKTIWLYTGYQWDDVWCSETGLQADFGLDYCNKNTINHKKRQEIVKQCNILVNGRYIDTQRDVTLKWCGSSNQRIIDVNKSLKNGEVCLWKC